MMRALSLVTRSAGSMPSRADGDATCKPPASPPAAAAMAVKAAAPAHNTALLAFHKAKGELLRQRGAPGRTAVRAPQSP